MHYLFFVFHLSLLGIMAQVTGCSQAAPPPLPPIGLSSAEAADGRKAGIIPYRSEWAYQLDVSENNFDLWFDGTLGDNPDTPTSYNLKGVMETTETMFTFPPELEVELAQINFYDGKGSSSNPLKVHLLLTDGKRIENAVPDFHGNQYLAWLRHEIPVKYQKVKAVIFLMPKNMTHSTDEGIYPSEIQFVGKYTPYMAPKAVPVTRVNFRNMYGVNSFPWDNTGREANQSSPGTVSQLSRFEHMGWNRAYDDWHLFEAVKDDYRFAPAHSGEWNQDRGFARLKERGVKSIQAIKTIPAWITDTYPKSHVDNVSYRNGENAYHPYKGNVAFYNNLSSFPAEGATNPRDFPFTTKEPTTYVANDTKLCYTWNGKGYVLRTTNDTVTYLDVFTKENATDANPVGKLKNVFNKNLDRDRVTPATYKAFAQMAFQSAARYGTNKAVDPTLVLTPDKLVGLDLLDGVEAGNEMNAHWHGRKRYLNPYEHAAFLSAFYDGHKGTLGPRAGVKKGDPKLKAYVGGIVSANPRFYRAMIDWCRENRGYRKDGTVDICWDVVKYHQYTTSSGLEQHKNGPRFAIPADMHPSATAKVQEMKNLHQHLVGRTVPVHIGELGYDVGPSEQGAADIKNSATGYVSSRKHTQGVWVLRDQLTYAYHGVDGLQFYILEDPVYLEDPYTSNAIYASSGFFARNFGKYPKEKRTAAWYSAQFQKEFGDYTPQQLVSSAPMVLKATRQKSVLYALWLPSMTGEVGTHTLALPGVTSVTLYSLVDNASSMKSQVIPIKGSYTAKISETPIFVKVN
ncbi:hypothetical protein [Rufibacter sp. XAAS-G3-1]|uniref:hypothetical protein n=1 Tax=Rufibacter sp. XAAS-G3-1 TaxID=2729134 RepID=UPI0015E759D2|nr:hypothetical protein [Rufibacter sp. XAAS-G3-1]